METNLNSAEIGVLRLLVGGMSDKEIAFAGDTSEAEVASMIDSICNKLGASDRGSAVKAAIRAGLVSIEL